MNKTSAPLIGQTVTRVEDERLLRGKGQYTDDINVEHCLAAVVLRSPHAHAEILSIDTSNAKQLPGVQAVLISSDIKDYVTGPIPSLTRTPPWDIRNVNGATLPDASMPVLADSIVRFVGEPVALIVADSQTIAEQARELIDIHYLDLPALVDPATDAKAKQLWHDAPNNRSLDIERGDRAKTDAAFSRADKTVSISVDINRIAPVFMEPRSAIGQFNNQRYQLTTGAQSAHSLKAGLSDLLSVNADDVRVIVPDMGGGFGARNTMYPEYVLVLLAARICGKPVRWTASRSESFVTDAQCRDEKIHGELALDADGNFLGLRCSLHWRHGAYLLGRNAAVLAAFFPPTNGGAYRIVTSYVRMYGAFSNTTPQAAFRGIGRLESNYLMERLVDHAAAVLNRDPIALRQQNLITPAELPWTTATGSTYTSGEFESNLNRALELADYPGFKKRRQLSSKKGLLRGIGVGMYIENDGASPSEYARVEVTTEKTVLIGVGTQDFGMGHKTMFAQIAADTLQLPFEDIGILFGDTDRIAKGAGSAGSRSARLGGSAIIKSAQTLLDIAKDHAGNLLEAATTDLEYREGNFVIAGTDKYIHLYDIAIQLQQQQVTLAAADEFVSTDNVHQNGCQICEVEIDPETGHLRIVNHIIVADVGRAVNPMIVHGQLHGGIAQGSGQAAFENVIVDRDTGQVLSGSLMDYCLPRAMDLPFFTAELNEVIETDNPVGAKGAGEGPTTGSPAAIVNAALNALAPLGVKEIDMPLTPERVWRAIKNAGTA